jgi:hypothetical protein
LFPEWLRLVPRATGEGRGHELRRTYFVQPGHGRLEVLRA